MRLSCVLFGLFLFACGPTGRPGNGGAGDGVDANGSAAPDALITGCTPQQENTAGACSDSIDNDCDGLYDCSDPDCSGIGSCPVCGMLQHPTGAPVQLPDGIIGSSCTSNAQCSGATPNCVEGECHASYTSKLTFTGFGATQTMTAISNIQSVCVNVSHEWLRDLEIALRAPSGQVVILDKFLGRTGGEVFLGHPTNTDGDCSACSPEQGFDYCWKPMAANMAMLPYANASQPMTSWAGHTVLPAGDYQSSDSFAQLIGATLNGDWTIVVTDLWPIDAGVIHEWSISFDPAIVQDCSGPIIQ